MPSLHSMVEIDPSSQVPGGAVSLISIADIDPLTATAEPRIASGVEEARSFRRVAFEGDVLFARISPSMENGKIALVPPLATKFALVSGELLVMRAKPGVDPRLVWAFLRQRDLLAGLADLAFGTAGRRRLDPGALEGLEIPVPGGARWETTSAVLDQLDRTLRGRREADAQLRSLAGSAAESLVGAAQMGMLGESAEFVSGVSGRLGEVGFRPILRTPDLVDGSVDLRAVRYLEEDLGATGRESPRLRSGDILFVRNSGSAEQFARSALYEGRAESVGFASYLSCIRPLGLNPDFLWAWLQSDRVRSEFLDRAGSVTGRFNLPLAELRQLPLPQVDVQLQERLGAIARASRRMLVLGNRQRELIVLATQAVLAHQFAGTSLGESAAPNVGRAPISVPQGFQPLFDAASFPQRVAWAAIIRGEVVSLQALGSANERAELQHTLGILEQIGVLVRERQDLVESWRLPDPETELV